MLHFLQAPRYKGMRERESIIIIMNTYLLLAMEAGEDEVKVVGKAPLPHLFDKVN